MSSRVIALKALKGGPALLLTRISASGQAAINAARVTELIEIACDLMNHHARRLPYAARRARELFAIPSADDDVAAGFGESYRASPAQPLA